VSLLWLDASAGIAGDMFLAALLDAGARLSAVQAAVDAVVPGLVEFVVTDVTRAGLRAVHVDVRVVTQEPQSHRRWRDLRALLGSAELDPGVRDRALAVFGALAAAEARVHGQPADEVHFHEVGAWDSIADVVGGCAALHDLGDPRIVLGPLALGAGSVKTEHGLLPVPVPAVLELVRGWSVLAGGDGELATPTGAALATTLAESAGPLPAMTVDRTGVGAGTRDTPGRPNVVRVVLGTAAAPAGSAASEGALERMTVVETTVDDLDPRVWPVVLEELLAAGAVDAWLTPVLMKKGRPGHVLTVLARPGTAGPLRRLVLDRTSALGVRQWEVEREILDRSWVSVPVSGHTVRVKVGTRDGVEVHSSVEFEDAARVAAATGRPVAEVLAAASAAYRSARSRNNTSPARGTTRVSGSS
jgi:uncharacterized protein (TIGR00299 family) protein